MADAALNESEDFCDFYVETTVNRGKGSSRKINQIGRDELVP